MTRQTIRDPRRFFPRNSLVTSRWTLLLTLLIAFQPFLITGSATGAHATTIDRLKDESSSPQDELPSLEQVHHVVTNAIPNRRASIVGQASTANLHLDFQCVCPLNDVLLEQRQELPERSCRIIVFEHSAAPIHETRGKPHVDRSRARKSEDLSTGVFANWGFVRCSLGLQVDCAGSSV